MSTSVASRSNHVPKDVWLIASGGHCVAGRTKKTGLEATYLSTLLLTISHDAYGGPRLGFASTPGLGSETKWPGKSPRSTTSNFNFVD